MKATDMGGSYIRFKAEVDFDGKEITLFYLQKQDLDLMLKVRTIHSCVEMNLREREK